MIAYLDSLNLVMMQTISCNTCFIVSHVCLVLVSVPSQSAVHKDHPWMKLVDPGPWYRLPPAPAPSAHSRCCPTTFNPFLEDDEDESKDEEVLNDNTSIM